MTAGLNATRRRFVVSTLCWLLLIGSATAWAADPKPQKVARVTIVNIDGKTVAGEMVEASPAGVSVRTSPKVDAVLVPWAEIKRTSNGLTRQPVVDHWKRRKPTLLCETCQGNGTRKCETCQGSGVDPAQAKACETCHGAGDVGKCPKCPDGKVACPSPCSKAESFSGAKDADGKRWRTFRGKSGTMRISDGHVGEQVVMEKGDPVMKGKCATCDGTTRVDCPLCQGSAKKACSACQGGGKTGPICMACQAGRTVCEACRGSGLKPGN